MLLTLNYGKNNWLSYVIKIFNLRKILINQNINVRNISNSLLFIPVVFFRLLEKYPGQPSKLNSPSRLRACKKKWQKWFFCILKLLNEWLNERTIMMSVDLLVSTKESSEYKLWKNYSLNSGHILNRFFVCQGSK